MGSSGPMYMKLQTSGANFSLFYRCRDSGAGVMFHCEKVAVQKSHTRRDSRVTTVDQWGMGARIHPLGAIRHKRTSWQAVYAKGITSRRRAECMFSIHTVIIRRDGQSYSFQ